ncbi:hypothetical protein [Streptomyces sp. NBC_00829]|uniref:hypothetical protein n=1 Tax=Streptomyces sp. NBC_00829 TaxID=2903679 RepID=UPI003864E014|nr:hypothetical protein OG293_06110 [Streptomyces sp. NBC_00829]
MRFERILVQGAQRSTDQVCRELTGFVERCLEDLGHPGAEHVHSVLGPAQPLLRILTARRGFPDSAVSLHVAEVEVFVSVSYDTRADDRLDVPIVKLHPGHERPPGALVVVHADCEVEPRMRLAAESAGGDMLRVEVRHAPPVGQAPARDATPGPQEVPPGDGVPCPEPVAERVPADAPTSTNAPTPAGAPGADAASLPSDSLPSASPPADAPSPAAPRSADVPGPAGQPRTDGSPLVPGGDSGARAPEGEPTTHS